MFNSTPAKKEVFDYIGAYEKAIHDLVRECGGRMQANMLLDDLHNHYEATFAELEGHRKALGEGSTAYAEKKTAILGRAQGEVHDIIDRHVPHTSEHVRELIIGASLAMSAIAMPMTYQALSTLAVATSIVAIGSSYYIGFKLLKDWRAISGRHKVVSLAGVVGPRHVHKSISKVTDWKIARKAPKKA